MSEILVGTDAEGFLMSPEGKVTSAIGLIKGDKRHPYLTTHGAWQADGVLAEFNSEPANSAQGLVENINNVLADLPEAIGNKPFSFSISPSARFSWDQLNSFEACVAGCDPDFNAWAYKDDIYDALNKPPILKETNLRTAAAHIHISWEGLEEHDELSRVQVARAMDLLHSLPSLFLDEDRERRKLYGKAGSFRIKPYGVECRTSSNWWIKKDGWIEWTFNQAKMAVDMVDYPLEDVAEEVVYAINSYDKDVAQRLISKFKIELP